MAAAAAAAARTPSWSALAMLLVLLLVAALGPAVRRRCVELMALPEPPQPLAQTSSQRRLVVVVDLDETLVHATEAGGQLTVAARPYAAEFVQRLKRAFHDVVIFTAATKEYADAVIDGYLGIGALLSARLYRGDCMVRADDGSVVKDLARVARALRVPSLLDVVIVDNTPSVFALQPGHGVPVTSWTGRADDTELQRLAGLLEQAAVLPGPLVHHVPAIRRALPSPAPSS